MKRLNTFSGQIVTSADLEYLQNAKDQAISERYNDILTDGIFRVPGVGVIGEFEISVNSIDPETFDIGHGTGKSTAQGLSERIVIPEDEDTEFDSINPTKTPPQSTGNKKIPLANNTNGVDNYIWIKYLNVQDSGHTSAHWQTGQVHYVRGRDGYQIIVNANPNYGNSEDFVILIGKITATGGDINPANISYANRSYVSLNAGFREELNPILVQYQKDSHSNGIISAEVEENFTREEFHLGFIGGYVASKFAYMDDGQKLGQSFTPTTNIKISSLELNLKAQSVPPSPLNNLKVSIYADDGGSPGLPDEASLIAKGSVNQELLTEGFNWITFNMFTPDPTPVQGADLISGTTYWIVLEKVSNDGIRYYVSHTVDLINNYEGTTYYEAKDDGTGWTGDTDNDLHFKIFEFKDVTEIKTTTLSINNIDADNNVPSLWVEQLRTRNDIEESIYVEGIRIFDLLGSEIVGDLVKVDKTNFAGTTGIYYIYVNEAGEVYIESSIPSGGFGLWQIDYDASLKVFKDFVDLRRYRLIAGNDIRGVDINDDNEFDFQENAVFEKDVNVKGDVNVEGRVTGLDGLEVMVPKGAIIMWSGTLGGSDGKRPDVDTGVYDERWALCDGTNGTPDLRDRFVIGAGNSYNIGDTGGANSYSLVENQLPSHSHSIISDGSHRHSIRVPGINSGGSFTLEVFSSGYYSYISGGPNPYLSSEGAHDHGAITGASGAGNSIDNRPLFYSLAFIMRIV